MGGRRIGDNEVPIDRILAVGTVQLLIDYWMGHENPEMSTRYGKQLLEDVKYRKRWAEKMGLGFDLPRASEPKLDVSCATCDTDSSMQACVANA
jgi:hypothetical protein